MSGPDLLLILKWWVFILITGVVFLPFTFYFFKNFFDKGYIFSKILGLTITAYVFFILSDLHLILFTARNIFSILFFLLLLSIYFIKKINLDFKKIPLRFFIFEEILFFISLLFWSYIRTFQPDIHGLEKFMDFGFVNSILRVKFMPPVDIWYPPYPINYYYFGHLITAIIIKATNINPKVGFNLMIANIFAFCFSGSFSIGANLIYFFRFNKNKNNLNIKSKIIIFIGGLITSFLVSFAGNLHAIYAFFKAYNVNNPLPFWQLIFSPYSFPNGYWYPNATRFIYHTIHEFPIYSFIVSDLHGHVLDIPIIIFTIAFFLNFIFKQEKEFTIFNKENFIYLFFIGFLLSVMYMTNAWDFFIYFFIFFLIMFFLIKAKIRTKIISLFLVFIFYLILSLPFSIFFRPFSIANEIGLICSPNFLINIGKIGPFVFEPDKCQHSYWWELLILYGFFIFNFLGFLFFTNKKKNKIDNFIIILSVASLILIIVPEFIYLKDIYATYFRANTMFKMVYQAFIIFSISTGYMLVRIISSFKENKKINKILLLIFIILEFYLLFLVFMYPFFAINGYYNNLAISQDLNGEKYLSSLYPDDYKAINWINRNIKNQPVLLEAQGDSYTDYERISANTGLPTVLGWTVHEWLWRGSYNMLIPRINNIKIIYETQAINLTKVLLKKYNIKYVYIGNLENKKYSVSKDKFLKLGKIIYSNKTVTLFKVNYFISSYTKN